MTETSVRTESVDAVIVGAGFGGLYMLHKLRQMGLMARLIEAGSDVGGTWYWNKYPGARCDVESALYSYSFDTALEQDWEWSERYPTQPEIQRYLSHVADRFELRRDIWFDTRVTAATFDDAADQWTVTTDQADLVTARWCIMATGNLSAARLPEIPGLAETSLPVYHTGGWPEGGVDFTGMDVAVVGTGSSGIQAIPEIARQAAHLTVYQRTASYTVPARNAPIDREHYSQIKRNYRAIRERWRTGELMGAGEKIEPEGSFRREVGVFEETEEKRRAEYEQRWNSGGAWFGGTFNDLMTDVAANETAADFIRGKIREIVNDPQVAEKLSPRGYPVGAKRLAVDTDYYATFNRNNVNLVDVRKDPIERVTDAGLQTASGERRHDALVFATGFDAMTGALTRITIRGSNGRLLADKWSAGPLTVLGLMSAGFPNLFFLTGPGSPSVLGNVVSHIEQHVELIADLLTVLADNGQDRIDAKPEAEQAWVGLVNSYAAGTLFPQANSWYLGANVPGKPRVFMPFVGGLAAYRQLCDQELANGLPSFDQSASATEERSGFVAN